MPQSATYLSDKFLTLAEMMNISEPELERRKEFLQFDAEDEAAARLLEMTLFFTEDLAANRRLMAIASRLVREVPVFELSFRRDAVTIHDVMNIVGKAGRGGAARPSGT